MSFDYKKEIKNLTSATLDIIDENYAVKFVSSQDTLVKESNGLIKILLNIRSGTTLRVYEFYIVKEVLSMFYTDNTPEIEPEGFALAIMEHLTNIENLIAYLYRKEEKRAELFNTLDYYRNRYFDRIYNCLIKNGITSIQDIHNLPINVLEKGIN